MFGADSFRAVLKDDSSTFEKSKVLGFCGALWVILRSERLESLRSTFLFFLSM